MVGLGVADRLARLRRRGGAERVAERSLAEPEQAWRLVADPSLWQLWMPGVGEHVGPVAPLRPHARYRVRLRRAPNRFGLVRGGEGEIVVEAFDGERVLAWALAGAGAAEPRRAGGAPRDVAAERYRLSRDGGRFRCAVGVGIDPEAVLAALDRETAWQG